MKIISKLLNIRKTAALICAAAVMLTLASCGAAGNSDTSTSGEPVAETSAAPTALDLSRDVLIIGYTPDSDALPFMQIGESIHLISIGAYTGEFYEDGSGEIRENVLAVTVFNDSDNDVEMLEIKMNAGETECVFIGSTIPSKSQMLICEKNGATYNTDALYSNVVMDAISWFDTPISMNESIFNVQAVSSVINVQNISDTAKTGVFIYYKYISGSVYIGGATRRINFGDINAGAIKQANEELFSADKCKIVMVSCDE